MIGSPSWAGLARLARSRAIARPLGLAASASLLFAFALAGNTVLPQAASHDRVRVYAGAAASGEPVPVPIPAQVSAEPIPVFLMRDDRSFVRHAVATAGADGVVRIEFFRSTAAQAAGATEALLFETGPGVLWLASPDESRAELRGRIGELQDQAGQSFEAVITSEVFTREYRPRLRAVLGGAVTAAWDDARSQIAFRDLLARSEPIVRDAMRTEIGEALRPRFEQALWDMARANWSNVLGTLVGYRLDYTPLNEAVAASLRDPALRRSLLELGDGLLGTVEAQRFFERLVIETVDALVRDPKAMAVAGDLMQDPRLHAELQPLSTALVDLLGALPRHLAGLGNESDLNPLAAQIFKSLTLKRSGRLIMFMTPEHRDRILRLDPDAAIVLKALDVRGAA